MAWNLNDMLNLGSHIHLVTDLVKGVMGEQPSENARPVAKGLYGIFGKKDERLVQAILQNLDVEDQKLLVDFWDWLFHPEPGNGVQWLESVWYRNEFFVFIAKKSEDSPSTEIGEDVITNESETSGDGEDGSKVKVSRKETRKIFSNPGTDGATVLVQQMLDHLKKGGETAPASFSAPKKRERAFRQTYEFYRKGPTPCHKVGEVNWFEFMENKYGVSKEKLKAAYEALNLQGRIPELWGHATDQALKVDGWVARRAQTIRDKQREKVARSRARREGFFNFLESCGRLIGSRSR